MAIFKKLPGTARRYVDIETGREYSRRQVDVMRGRKTKNAAAIKKHRGDSNRYNALLRDYIEKQIQLGNFEVNKKGRDRWRGLRKKARESAEMKEIVKDLKSNDPFRKKRALEKTIRRDRVPETIPVGETPSVYSGGM